MHYDDFFPDDDIITHKILTFGSLMGILSGKELSVVALLNMILHDEDVREWMCLFCDCDFTQVIREMGKRYENLGTSKKITKINDDRTID